MNKTEIKLDLPEVSVAATLAQVEHPGGLIIFVDEMEATHLNAKNNFIADVLNENNFSTLLVDYLTPGEIKAQSVQPDIHLLKTRLIRVTEKAIEQFAFDKLPVGYFAIGSGAAVAFEAASFFDERIKAIVSLSGKTDLINNLNQVNSPTLLISGSMDDNLIERNKKNYDGIKGNKKIEIVDGASHSFEEPGTLNKAGLLASSWFELYLSNKKIKENVSEN